ncbi:MAG: hypothetical protein HYY18_00275 [Planctomycetes bacterium]|nr:hypothetical protein [Planctomycetota bacterium]
MKLPRRLLPLLLLLAGCGKPEPAPLLQSALANSAAAPHTIKGRATRTVGSSAVSWDITGAFAGPYAYVELDVQGMKRKTYGMKGWWVEQWMKVWRAYPPPHEAVEWLEASELSAAAYGPDQTINGVACRRVEAKHPAGKIHFDISNRDSRIVHAQGVVLDNQDAYAFEVWMDYSGGRVEPPAEVAVVLGALSGKRPEGGDAAAKEAAEKAWGSVVTAECSISMLQVDYASGVEHQRTSGYMQQLPPLRASERSVGAAKMCLYSDGVRTVAADFPGGPIREVENMPPVTTDGMSKLIEGAVSLGDTELRGEVCRLVGARLRPAEGQADGSSAAAWLWISKDGKLLRQVLVGKFAVKGELEKEVTSYVDLLFEHEKPTGQLIDAARRVFQR